MQGIYVIAIAFLASWAVSAAEENDLEEDTYQDILRVCPYPERDNTTTTNLPHETDCTSFYKCDVGRPVLQRCPLMTEGDPITRLHYNRRLQVCDWPWQAGCATCPQRYRNGTYPTSSRINLSPDNCYQYYDCINGVPYLRNCGPGTCFSRTCQECVVNRAGGICGNLPIPTWTPAPTIPTIPTIPEGCRNPSGWNGDRRSHECDCGKYYICNGVDWNPLECGSGLHFSSRTGTCLSPPDAGCLLP